ncbi:17015_t:CDS:1, partial [Racocetra persica]
QWIIFASTGGNYVSRWTECRSVKDFDGTDSIITGYSTPWWAAGYYFESYDYFYGQYFKTDYVMWYYDNA